MSTPDRPAVTPEQQQDALAAVERRVLQPLPHVLAMTEDASDRLRALSQRVEAQTEGVSVPSADRAAARRRGALWLSTAILLASILPFAAAMADDGDGYAGPVAGIALVIAAALLGLHVLLDLTAANVLIAGGEATRFRWVTIPGIALVAGLVGTIIWPVKAAASHDDVDVVWLVASVVALVVMLVVAIVDRRRKRAFLREVAPLVELHATVEQEQQAIVAPVRAALLGLSEPDRLGFDAARSEGFDQLVRDGVIDQQTADAAKDILPGAFIMRLFEPTCS